MIVNRRFFPEIMLDNDENYLLHLEGVCESIDELCEMEIIKSIDSYKFRISTSHPKYNQTLLQEIIKLNNLYQIRLDISKSIRTSGVLEFGINL
ncbi:MAG: hypothetical protein H5T96_09235 [Tissierellales bacterium]|nr:hypothetical protein [Tissierellales bacterium]